MGPSLWARWAGAREPIADVDVDPKLACGYWAEPILDRLRRSRAAARPEAPPPKWRLTPAAAGALASVTAGGQWP